MADGDEAPRLSEDSKIDNTAPPPDPWAGAGVGIVAGSEEWEPHEGLFPFMGGSDPNFETADNVYVSISGDGSDILGGAQSYNRNRGGAIPGQTTLRAARDWWWNINEHQRASWQRMLWAAGYMKDEPPVWGKVDPFGRDFKAWESAINNAARLDTPVDILLEELISQDARSSIFGDGSGEGRRRPDIRLTGRGDARKMAEQVAQEVLGRNLSAEEMERVVQRLHSVESSQQGKAIDVSQGDGGGTFTSPDSARTVIESSVEGVAPVEAKGKDQVDAFAKFMTFFGG